MGGHKVSFDYVISNMHHTGHDMQALYTETAQGEAKNHPDLLARAVLLLHRLAIPIHALIMQRSQGCPTMRITIEILADPERSDRIAENLANSCMSSPSRLRNQN